MAEQNWGETEEITTEHNNVCLGGCPKQVAFRASQRFKTTRSHIVGPEFSSVMLFINSLYNYRR